MPHMSKQTFYSLLLFLASLALHLTVTLPTLVAHFNHKDAQAPAAAPAPSAPGGAASTSVPLAPPTPRAPTPAAPAQAEAPAPTPHAVDPRKDARLSKYAACIATFLDNITAYKTCLDRHAGRKCWFDSSVMSSQHDSHNCLAIVSGVAVGAYNARVIGRAHDVCYAYLVTFGECLGLAVEMEDLSPCFRKEVFARFGLVVRECKTVTDFQEPRGSAMWRGAVRDIEMLAALRLHRVLRDERREELVPSSDGWGLQPELGRTWW